MPAQADHTSHPSPKRPSGSSPHDAPSYVLVGPLRAGTTLFHLILNSHPQIASVGEFEEAVEILSNSGWPDLDHYRAWLNQHRVASARNYASQPHASTYAQHAQGLWRQLASKHDKPIIGCNIHSRFDRARDLWPNTKFIHLIRDPRDVANSCVGMGWFGHPAKATPIWLDTVRRWNTLARSVPPEDRIVVRYEDLLKDPEHELGRCCELLGLSYHPDMLKFFETSSYEPLDPRLAEQWQRKMKPRTAELIDAQCADLMKSYGYTPSTKDPKPANWIESASIALKNRLNRFRWRVERYGVRLVLRWAIVKRLSLAHPLRLATIRRIHEIDTQHLR